ncbi:MAG: extracellular solute-binding protein [Treponema sp.]|jgi:ABC-type glycerol-3-phosphate transport system substrate-binding protein|nr:extracellular solute-binding protein [Treponema sp.]
MKIQLTTIDKLLVALIAVVVVVVFFIKISKKTVQDAMAGVIGRQLVFSHSWQNEEAQTVLRKLADDFEAQLNGDENGKLTIVLRDYPADYVETMLTTPSTEDGDKKKRDFLTSDIFIFNSHILYEAVQNGWLASLADYLRADDLQTETREEEWAIPLTSDIYMLFYNIDALTSPGFDRPPKNWDEFKKYARILSSPGKYGLTLSLNADDDYPDVYPWLWVTGALMMKDGSPNLGDAAISNTLQFFADLNQDGVIAPGSFHKTKRQKIKEFTENKAAMMIGSIEDIETVRQKMYESSFGVSTIPVPDKFSGKPIFGLMTTFAGIGARSALQEEAWAFLSFLLEHSSDIAAAVRALPGNGNTPVPAKESPSLAKVYDMFESSDTVEELSGMPNARSLAQIFCTETASMLDESQSQARIKREELRAAESEPAIITRSIDSITAESARKTVASIQRQWEGVLSKLDPQNNPNTVE